MDDVHQILGGTRVISSFYVKDNFEVSVFVSAKSRDHTLSIKCDGRYNTPIPMSAKGTAI